MGFQYSKENGKSGIPKDSHKKGSKHAGHADVGSPKQSKREGKKSPWLNSGRPSSTKLHSPSGYLDYDFKGDRKTDPSDSTRKLKEGGVLHPGELSINTQQFGYQPLLAIKTSPPTSRSTSSMSPRDRKSVENRGSDIERQRQILEWQMAAASQHGYYYDPQQLWSPTGFGTSRTSMITSPANTMSTQESVLRAALVAPGAVKTAGSSMSSPKLHTSPAPADKSSTEGTHKRSSESNPKMSKSMVGKSLGDITSGRGTPSGKHDIGTRHPPVGIALAQKRLETEKRSTENVLSSQNSSRDRHEERLSSRHREPSRGTFSPGIQRESRSADSHRDSRSGSNPSSSSNPGGSTSASHGHHPDILSHPSPFSPFPHCFPHLAQGHGNPSQPFWMPGFGLPSSHSSSSLPAGFQDIPLPGNLGITNREGAAGRQLLGMFPPHLPGAEGGLHGLGWFQPWLPPPTLHHLQQLGGLNPSLLAQFPHLAPPGSSPLNQPLHLLTGQGDQTPPMGREMQTLIQQQQEALFQWYRHAAELQSRHHPFHVPSSDERLRRNSSPLHVHHHRCTDTPSGSTKQSSKSGDNRPDSSGPEKKSVKPEQETSGRNSGDSLADKITAHQPIMPPFLNSVPLPPGPHMPYIYPHLPYRIHEIRTHSPNVQPKVEHKDAGTNSHSPAGVMLSVSDKRQRHKSEPKDIKSLDSSLKSACVQTSPSEAVDSVNTKETEEERSRVNEPSQVKRSDSSEQTIDVILVDESNDSGKNDAQKLKEMTQTVPESNSENVKMEESGSNTVEEKKDSIDRDTSKGDEKIDHEETASSEPKQINTDTKEIQNISNVSTTQSMNSTIKDYSITSTSVSVSEPSYTTSMDCLKRESLITSVISTTNTVASKMEDLDQDQLAAIEGIALLSEAAEQKTFAAICIADKKVSEPGGYSGLQDAKTTDVQKDNLISEDSSSNVQSPHQDLSVSINTVELEMKLKLAELQRKYKEKKKELDKLQRKKDKRDRLSSKELEVVKKRGPGRPRKKKNQLSSDAGQKLSQEKSMPSSNIQSPTAVLLEAAASLEGLPMPTKKKKKEKRKDKMKSKRESLEELDKEIKELKRKKKKHFKKQDSDQSILSPPTKSKKKTKYTGICWPPPPLPSSRKKISNKSGEKKKKTSKMKSPSSPLPSIFSSTMPIFNPEKLKPKLPISHVYGDSSDSDEEDSSQMSFDMMPKGLALLASTAELSSGHSTPVKRPSKRSKEPIRMKKEGRERGSQGGKKRSLSVGGATSSPLKKLKATRRKEKTRSPRKKKKVPTATLR